MQSTLIYETSSYASCRDELVAFKNLNRSQCQDGSYSDWRYQQRPLAEKAVILWARESNGDPVGMVSLLPVRYAVRGTEWVCGSFGDFSVRPDQRGRGLGTSLVRQLVALDEMRFFSMLLVLPNHAAERALFRAGWRKATMVHRAVRISGARPDVALSRRLSQRSLSLQADLLAALAGLTRLRIRSWMTEEVSSFDQRFDELWERFEKRNLVVAIRDRAYLRWRFERHSRDEHRILTLNTAGSLIGYLVYSVQDGSCAVKDLLCTASDAVPALLNDLVRRLRHGKLATRITVNLSSPGAERMLLSAGFVSRPDPQPLLSWTDSDARDCLRRLPWYCTAADKDV